MAEKNQTIVIKKITVVAGGHGGSWKVALADFMTALMCFFLVMWLLGQSAETKKAVSDYFSTPSIIEYNFQNFGAEITLEKLFLDLINEPLKAFQQFMEPIDKTPNILDSGSQKVVMATIADQLGDLAKNPVVTSDTIEFDIYDYELFIPGTSTPNDSFLKNMEKIKILTTGLKDANVEVISRLFRQSVKDERAAMAQIVGSERLDLVGRKIQASFENNTVDYKGDVQVRDYTGPAISGGAKPPGFIHVKITQKELTADGKKPRKMEAMFGDPTANLDFYKNLLNEKKTQKK